MLSRAECFRILELDPRANSYEIENRYVMLIKRYHGKDDEESRATLERISLAYNILTGKYIEPEPIDPRLEQVVFGKSRYQWKNIWHYGKRAFFAGLIGFGLLGYLIYTIATNKPADFQFAVVGLFGTTDDANERIETYTLSVFPEMDEIEYQLLPLDLSVPDTSGTETGGTSGLYNNDTEGQYAYVMKMMTLLAADTIEVYICDKPVFDNYAPQGAFADLTPLYGRLKESLPEEVFNKIKPLRRALDEGDEPNESETSGTGGTTTAGTTQSTEDAANQDESLPVYGLDVTALSLTQGLGLYSQNQILTIGIRTENQAQTEEFLSIWIGDYELMHQQQKEYEDSLKAETAETTAETTAAAAD